MTQQDKNREAFKASLPYSPTRRPSGEYISPMTAGRWETWQAARDLYAPKLTEKEAVEVVLNAFDKAYRSGDTYIAKNFVKGGIAALRAAGVRFKEEP